MDGARTAAAISLGIVSAAPLSDLAGGLWPVMREHAASAMEAGMAVTIHGPSRAREHGAVPPGVRQVPFTPILRRAAFAPRLTRALIASDPDVLHQHGLWLYPSVAVSSWRRRTRRPVVISTHGMLEPWAMANSAARKRLAMALFEGRNLGQASCLHCTEGEVAAVRKLGFTNPVAVLPNGVRLPAEGAARPRPAWLPDDGRRTLLFFGRLHPKKGLLELIEGWAKLIRTFPSGPFPWRLVIAGWSQDAYGETCRMRARELGLADVLFAGAVFGEEKEALLAHSDAFILPSRSEGLPLAVLEAWSHGLPVFMTRACNLPSGFSAGAAIEIGLEPEDLARTLSRELFSETLDETGRAGLNLARSHFSWDQIGESLRSVYTWLARGGPRPACVEVT